MNKLVYTAFVAFWAGVASLLAVNALVPPPAVAAQEKAYTLTEVAKHASLDDCWLAIEGAVYDVTAYVPNHPAPPTVLADWCGKEATEGMQTKGYGRPHSHMAWEMLETYRVGVVKAE